MQKIYFIRFF